MKGLVRPSSSAIEHFQSPLNGEAVKKYEKKENYFISLRMKFEMPTTFFPWLLKKLWTSWSFSFSFFFFIFVTIVFLRLLNKLFYKKLKRVCLKTERV